MEYDLIVPTELQNLIDIETFKTEIRIKCRWKLRYTHNKYNVNISNY